MTEVTKAEFQRLEKLVTNLEDVIKDSEEEIAILKGNREFKAGLKLLSLEDVLTLKSYYEAIRNDFDHLMEYAQLLNHGLGHPFFKACESIKEIESEVKSRSSEALERIEPKKELVE